MPLTSSGAVATKTYHFLIALSRSVRYIALSRSVRYIALSRSIPLGECCECCHITSLRVHVAARVRVVSAPAALSAVPFVDGCLFLRVAAMLPKRGEVQLSELLLPTVRLRTVRELLRHNVLGPRGLNKRARLTSPAHVALTVHSQRLKRAQRF